MAESTAAVVSRDFRDKASTYFSTRQDYISVHAILLHWREHDIDKLEQEVSAFRKLLEDAQYYVTTLLIPTDGTQQQTLNLEIAAFVKTKSHRPDSLIIVYYAGHCNPTSGGRAEWASSVHVSIVRRSAYNLK